MRKVTEDMVRNWLGLNENGFPLDERGDALDSIELITDIANGDYTPKAIKKEIEEHNNA
jgi:hypothetical protein